MQRSVAETDLTEAGLLASLLQVRARSNEVFAQVNHDRERYYDAVCAEDHLVAVQTQISMDEGAAELVRMNVIEADLEAKLHQLGVPLPAIDGKTLVRLLTSCEALRPSETSRETE